MKRKRVRSKDKRSAKSTTPSTLYVLTAIAVCATLIVGISKIQHNSTSATKAKMAQTPTPTLTPPFFTADDKVTWKTVGGRKYPYAFSYPETLSILAFIDDPIDALAINWNNIPPQQNILSNIEFLDANGRKYVAKQKNYVADYWKFFSGLKGVNGSVEEFTNSNGLKGFKARYLDSNGQFAVQHVFFIIPNDNRVMIHLANGPLDPKIFNKIVDTVSYTVPPRTKKTR